MAGAPCVVILDIGSSSIRSTLVAPGMDLPIGFAQVPFNLHDELQVNNIGILSRALSTVERALIEAVESAVVAKKRFHVAAIGCSSFVGNWALCQEGSEPGPLHTYAETGEALVEAADQVARNYRSACDLSPPVSTTSSEAAGSSTGSGTKASVHARYKIHAATGAPLHPAYAAPGMLLHASTAPPRGRGGSAEEPPPASASPQSDKEHLVTVGGYVMSRLGGMQPHEVGLSLSEASWLGLWRTPKAVEAAAAPGPRENGASGESGSISNAQLWETNVLRASGASESLTASLNASWTHAISVPGPEPATAEAPCVAVREEVIDQGTTTQPAGKRTHRAARLANDGILSALRRAGALCLCRQVCPAGEERDVEVPPVLFRCVGDGAAAAIGSGCLGGDRISVTIGTSAAARTLIQVAPDGVVPSNLTPNAAVGSGSGASALRLESVQHGEVAETGPGDEPLASSLGCMLASAGLWMYQVTKDRFLVGGALTDGGSVVDWVQQKWGGGLEEGDGEGSHGKRAAAAAAAAGTRSQVSGPKASAGTAGAAAQEADSPRSQPCVAARVLPPASPVGCLPFLHGERSTGWRANATLCLDGMNGGTGAGDVALGAAQAVCFRLREITDALSKILSRIPYVEGSSNGRQGTRAIGSGGCLEHSALRWIQDAGTFRGFVESSGVPYARSLKQVRSLWAPLLCMSLDMPLVIPGASAKGEHKSGTSARSGSAGPSVGTAASGMPVPVPVAVETTTRGVAALIFGELVAAGVLRVPGPGSAETGMESGERVGLDCCRLASWSGETAAVEYEMAGDGGGDGRGGRKDPFLAGCELAKVPGVGSGADLAGVRIVPRAGVPSYMELEIAGSYGTARSKHRALYKRMVAATDEAF